MYWLLAPYEQEKLRNQVDRLVTALSTIGAMGHDDQLWPFVGRKNRLQAKVVIEQLTNSTDVICDPFSGSGTFGYAAQSLSRQLALNEFEVYNNRMANAPWRIPDIEQLKTTYGELLSLTREKLNYLYKTICSCGKTHVLDSQFFDRIPLKFNDVTRHERLGQNGETITYRGVYKCPNCGRSEKHFDNTDEAHFEWILEQPEPRIFNAQLIENSRINLSSEFTRYGALFPQRSKLALEILWNSINKLEADKIIISFLQDIFLSILPQAKYKDYRSKSQDLHCPNVMLREVNLLYRFQKQFKMRLEKLVAYGFPDCSDGLPIQCKDYREFFDGLSNESVGLVLTDPPWSDGNAYFEKAQLYHPWMNYSLIEDQIRLDKEVVVTDAPSRVNKNDEEQWWSDIGDLFKCSSRVLKDRHFLALFFRPVPARYWLRNLNRMKLLARREGFEPLLCIDVSNADPSMRIQQSASYTFTNDLVFLLLKLPKNITRRFIGNIDIDQIAYQSGEHLQETLRGPFTFQEWQEAFRQKLTENNCLEGTRLSSEITFKLFDRYTDKVTDGKHLPKPVTPFSDQLFDTPAIERLATYVPHVVYELSKIKTTFSYGDFLLRLAGYVENGTRSLIGEIESLDICKLIEIYAEPLETGKLFRLKELPVLANKVSSIIQLEPYDFEAFVANLLVKMGFSQVALVGRTGDRGVDILALDPNEIRSVVQCKRYLTANVNATPIQRLDSYARTRNAGRKILITTSDFTPQAKEEALLTGTELVNGHELEKFMAIHWPEWQK